MCPMTSLVLREFHRDLGAHFTAVNGRELVADYGDWRAEHAAARSAAAVIDLSPRGRLCLTGNDRVRFLNGQVTNDVKALRVGQGCYAALLNAKGKMQSDLFIYALAEELLLDFEPGFSAAVAARLEQYVIADDVQIVDASPQYGLLTVQGPRTAEAVGALGFGVELPDHELTLVRLQDAVLGELYLVKQSRVGLGGCDLFVPATTLPIVAEKLIASVKAVGGGACGWTACEAARVEAGIPRFGVDLDETTLPPEAGLESRAISYTKGCYTGQEIIARLRTYGQVAKTLRVLQLSDCATELPTRGEKLFQEEREVGYVTSAVWSPMAEATVALGYVRRECNALGTVLKLRRGERVMDARIVSPPIG
jgi:folate-binding protein YgfZ